MKYDLKGFGKLNAVTLFAAMASGPLSFLTNGTLGKFTYYCLKKFGSWAANKGLIFVNVGAEFFEGGWDMENFDEAMDHAIKKVLQTKSRLTEDEKKEIDDKVIKALRRFAILTKHN